MVFNDDVLQNIYEGKVIADSDDAYEALEFWMLFTWLCITREET